METIPTDTLETILALRSENGLESSEQALSRDLKQSKAKWTLEEKTRYRRAGRSPIFVSGRYLSSHGLCPATGESDTGGGKKSSSKGGSQKKTDIDEAAFYKVLHGKGFAVKMVKDLLTGEVRTELPATIENLGLKFEPIAANASGVHVTQTSPQIQVSMSLDKFLELTRIKP